MADQGFPIGGGGGADLRRGCFLAKTYGKMKELDPVGGGHAPPAPPGSANECNVKLFSFSDIIQNILSHFKFFLFSFKLILLKIHKNTIFDKLTNNSIN